MKLKNTNPQESLRIHFQFQIDQSTDFITIGMYLKDNSLKIVKFQTAELDFILEILYTNNWNYVIGTWIPIFRKVYN
ncbi:hypothetical protein UFOVP787_4 [uncultured Caudovirales phage]|uniref:Uncharacterized protein n=1 Tax=uncultured Caudovirales phage TaxID=2100421 RepID=A0A6J5NWE8_9CAUD|nr:hypothetical protein UFOVP787_4 [uncultured Caudovirales phage]